MATARLACRHTPILHAYHPAFHPNLSFASSTTHTHTLHPPQTCRGRQEFMTAFKSSADLFGLSVMAAMEDIEDEDFDLADKSLETSVLFDNLFEMADADNSGGIDKEVRSGP